MAAAVRALKEKLGNDAVSDLEMLIEEAGREWKDQVLSVASERFERRLGQEMSGVRIDLAKEFAGLRVDLAREAAALRVEFAETRADVLKWSFLFWVGQFTAISGMMAYLLRTIGSR